MCAIRKKHFLALTSEAMDAAELEAMATATTAMTEVDDALALAQLPHEAQDATAAVVEGAGDATAAALQEQLPPTIAADVLDATTSDAWHTTAAPAAMAAAAVIDKLADDAPVVESAALEELMAAAEDEDLQVGAEDASNFAAEHDAPLQHDTSPAADAESGAVANGVEESTGRIDQLDGGASANADAGAAEVVDAGAGGDAPLDGDSDIAAAEPAKEVESVSAELTAAAAVEATPATTVEETEDVVMAESGHQQNDSAGAEAEPDVEMTASEQQQRDDGVVAITESGAVAADVQAGESARQIEEYDPSYNENAYDPAANLPHAQDEYDPADSSYEQHGSDEYDPANPSAFNGGEYDPENPAYEQDEYDPSAPSYDAAHGSPSGADAGQSDPVNKRKPPTADAQHPETERDVKRQRSDSHDSSRSLDGKSRRDSDAQAEDKKGLSDAAWDRLKDFQTLGEFQINQVSRAAFASVGSLPEFAQVSIISRFTRVPLKGVRDKNGQLMRIHHEYLKENPHVASLQSVSVFVADYTSDPGLFEFGYAPPFPVNGMSTVPVPYQKPETTTHQQRASSAPTTAGTSGSTSAAVTASPSIDEFGRTVKKADPTSPKPTTSSERAARAADPRKAAAQERADEPPPQAIAVDKGDNASSSVRKPFDPRRRLAEENESSAAAVSDPRRTPVTSGAGARAGGEVTSVSQSGDPRRRNLAPSGPAPSQAVPAKSELYDRLPVSVKSVLDGMVREGRLRETINDNVISRLNHLPEHVALRAVENFSNVDLTHIDNLQGFLVGIINRVNEKAIAAERTEASSLARAGGVGAAGGYSNDSGAVLGYPGGRHAGRQGVYSRDQTEGYSNAPPGMNGGGGGATGGYSQQYGASSGMRAPSLNVVPAAGHLPQQQPLSVHSGSGHYQQHHQQAHQYQQHQSQFGIHSLPLSVQQRLRSMAASGAITSVDELSDKCYELLSQLSEGLANEVLTRFMNANLTTVRNRSGFLIGVVKRCRQEYGFN